MLHLGPIWYHSEPSDVPYSQNLPRPIIDLDFSYSKTTLVLYSGSFRIRVEANLQQYLIFFPHTIKAGL